MTRVPNEKAAAGVQSAGTSSTSTPQFSENSHSTAQQDDPAPPEGKREASSYPGSYRPSDAQSNSQATNIASPIHNPHTGLPEDPVDTADHEELPPYSEHLGVIEDDSGIVGTQASVADDGRVNINIEQNNNRLSVLLAPALRTQFKVASSDEPLPPPYIPPSLGGSPDEAPPPCMNVVIHVVGSRGDVQPFVALGKVLKETYGHRVRLATHPTFKKFVEENGLEFFNISGDPSELMAFMVKNPGLMPGFDTLRRGDIGHRRRGIADMLKGCWRSCIETGDGFGVEASDDTVEDWMSTDLDANAIEPTAKPFVADAIIANPPSFAHIHCAEKLGIPLHMMFTMPWSPTQQFPHPLANIQSTDADHSMTNFMSYALVDMLTWQGLGDVINRFRKHSLGLEPVSLIWGPGILQRLKIPYTYCWSPALIPKPKDWANFISLSGFYFLNLASNYTPEPALAQFLNSGPPPVYIGFGSIVVDDPDGMTKLIFEAVKKTGQRALVSKGWGGFGADEMGIPEGVFMLGNVPHDWLFKQVSCVVHHGGAGTTAAGIAAGRPTVVVPFFGDQPFWGAMVARAGAGPDPIHHKELNADNLAAAINKCLEPASLERAQELSSKIATENGTQTGAQSFHQMLKVDDLRCSVAPHRMGAWRVRRTKIRLSTLAATVLIQEKVLTFEQLKLYRAREYEADTGPMEPITGGGSALIGTMSTMMMGVADFPVEALKGLGIHPDAADQEAKQKKKAEKEAKKEAKKKAKEEEKARRAGSGAPASQSNTSLTVGDSSSTRSGSTTQLQQFPSISVTDSTETLEKVKSPEDMKTPSQSTATSPALNSERASFMAEAMRQRSASGSRTHSPGGHRRGTSSSGTGTTKRDSQSSQRSEKDSGKPKFDLDTTLVTSKGVGRIVGAGFKAPLDFSMAISRGFHNASRLYGDEPRQIDRVDGFRDGVKTSAKEFGLGMFHGISGLAMDPIRGAKKEGVAGFTAGVGKGIIGAFLKPSAALFAIPAYTMKGIYRELSKPFGPNIENYIFAARVAQGYDDLAKSTPEERQDILQRWGRISKDVKRWKHSGKQPVQEQQEGLRAMLKKHRDERRATLAQNRSSAGSTSGQSQISSRQSGSALAPSTAPSTVDLYAPGPPGIDRGSTTYSDAGSQSTNPTSYSTIPYSPNSIGTRNAYPPSYSGSSNYGYPSASEMGIQSPTHPGIPELPNIQPDENRLVEKAIGASLNDTSHADQREDELMDRAIRASIAELDRPRDSLEGEEDEEALVQRAIDASMAEATASGASAAEQQELEEVMRKSLTETSARAKRARMHRLRSSDSEWDSDSDESFEDVSSARMREEDEMSRVMEASLAAQREEQEREEERRREEAELKEVLQQSQEDEMRVRELRERSELDDPDLKEVLQQSQIDEERERLEREAEEREEAMVLEYVKKQSLQEDEMRRRARTGLDEKIGEASGSAGRS